MVVERAVGQIADLLVVQAHEKKMIVALLPADAAVRTESQEPAVRRQCGIAVIIGVIREPGELLGLTVERIEVAAAVESQSGKKQAPAVRGPGGGEERDQSFERMGFDDLFFFDVHHIEPVPFAALGDKGEFAGLVDVDAAAEQMNGFEFRGTLAGHQDLRFGFLFRCGERSPINVGIAAPVGDKDHVLRIAG
ncbi:MAG: hypothetical protein BWY83_02672 [bacterium ADurb.Bin478]|nr:MAG: hypothetical protein BWY83_02672 [bacterium ADurb.Bin478]